MKAFTALGAMRFRRQQDDIDALHLSYSFQVCSEFRTGVHDEQARETKLGEDLLIHRLRNRGRARDCEGNSYDETGHSFHNVDALAITVSDGDGTWGPDVGEKHVKWSITR
jgi:hypothetical protein